MYNPETGQFMGMYPYPAPFFPTPIYPTNMPYVNTFRGGNYRGRFPRRGRSSYRGRNGMHSYDERDNSHSRRHRDHRRRFRQNLIHSHQLFWKIFGNNYLFIFRSDSRSRSRSRKRSRSRSRSRSRESRRSRSRSYSRRYRKSIYFFVSNMFLLD